MPILTTGTFTYLNYVHLHMTEKDERVSTSVNKEFKRALRVEAAKRDKTMSELVREILMENFEVEEGNGRMRTTAKAVS